MNYEVKYINPISVLINATRVFVVVGFVVAFLTFFFPNQAFFLASVPQKILATLLFTVVYTLIVSLVLAFIAWLYNRWAGNFKGINIHLEQKED
jgi:hypothetical protein